MFAEASTIPSQLALGVLAMLGSWRVLFFALQAVSKRHGRVEANAARARRIEQEIQVLADENAKDFQRLRFVQQAEFLEKGERNRVAMGISATTNGRTQRIGSLREELRGNKPRQDPLHGTPRRSKETN